jgi:CheY-like chemotaxis protein
MVRDELPESEAIGNRSILVVDDDPALCAMFARALDSFGAITCARNGIEAVRRLGEKTFSVVLMDLHMPGMDGFTILRLLANPAGRNHDTPVVIVTADISDSARSRALEHAVFALTKPVRIQQLLSLVTSTLEKRQHCRQNEAAQHP